MSLFSKLNQIKDLKEKAKTLQNALAGETISLDKNNTTLVMDGNQKIVKLNINPELLTTDKKTRLEETIMDLHNDAIGKVQKLMAEKMRSMGDFNIPGLN